MRCKVFGAERGQADVQFPGSVIGGADYQLAEEGRLGAIIKQNIPVRAF